MSTKRCRKRVHSVLQDDGFHDGLLPKTATKLPVRRDSSRSCKIAVEDHDVVAEWTAVGVARGLSSDADIARFLLSLCAGVTTSSIKEKLPPPEMKKCAICQSPLVLHCMACHLSPSQTRSTQPPHPSQSLSFTVDSEWSGPSPPLLQADVGSSALAQPSVKDPVCTTDVAALRSSSERGDEDLCRPFPQPDSWDASDGPGRECDNVVCGWGGFVSSFCAEEKQDDVSEKQSGLSEEHGGESEKQSGVSKRKKQSDVREKRNVVSISELDNGDSDRSNSQAADSDSKQFSTRGGHHRQGVCHPVEGRNLSLTLGAEVQSENLGDRRESLRKCSSRSDRELLLYICPHCDAHLPSSRHKHHVMAHHHAGTEGALSCEACAKPFPHLQALYSHTRLSSKDQKCGQCGETLLSGCQVGKHKKQHEREKARRCRHCLTSFPAMTKKDFDRHVQKHEKQRRGKKSTEAALCPQCGKVFKKKDDLDTHLTYHNKDSPFPCPLCPKAFKNKACLRQHELFHGEKTQQCEVCGAKFFRKAGLRRHMQKHTGKRFVCQECARRFCSPTELQVHVDAVHKGIRPFPCNRCPLKFYKAASLKIHMRTHTGEKPFSCSQCSARFSVGEALRKHMRRHTGEKPFCCEDCGQRYACQYSYQTHRKKHHTEVQYPCEDCQQAFLLRSSLNFHRSMCHDGKRVADAGNRHQLSGQEVPLQGIALL